MITVFNGSEQRMSRYPMNRMGPYSTIRKYCQKEWLFAGSIQLVWNGTLGRAEGLVYRWLPADSSGYGRYVLASGSDLRSATGPTPTRSPEPVRTFPHPLPPRRKYGMGPLRSSAPLQFKHLLPISLSYQKSIRAISRPHVIYQTPLGRLFAEHWPANRPPVPFALECLCVVTQHALLPRRVYVPPSTSNSFRHRHH